MIPVPGPNDPSPASRRLGKRDVERLLAGYDDDPVAALTDALRVVLGAPHASWDDLVRTAGFEPERQRSLIARETTALDELAGELNELRTLPR